MNLKNITDIHVFLSTINACKGPVWLESVYGDKYNLKSELSLYTAIAALISDHGKDLELYCGNKEDEGLFLGMFRDHPDML